MCFYTHCRKWSYDDDQSSAVVISYIIPSLCNEPGTRACESHILLLGNDGFIAQQSEGKRLDEKNLSSENSEALFQKIIHSASATNESKRYAACGLSIINKNRLDEFFIARGFVTVLQGDVLRKEDFASRIAKIKEKGCEG